MTAVSCGDPEPERTPRNPDDITGFYDVNYRMWVDGTPVSPDMIPGRVEVTGDPERELALEFYPDNEIIKFLAVYYSSLRESLAMRPVRPEGSRGSYTFDDYESMVALEFMEDYYNMGPLVMNGSIVAKTESGSAYGDVASDLANLVADNPGFYHDIEMTIEMNMPIEGNLFRKISIEIENRGLSGGRFPDRRP